MQSIFLKGKYPSMFGKYLSFINYFPSILILNPVFSLFFTQNRNFIDFFIDFLQMFLKLQLGFSPISPANFEVAAGSS